MTGRDSLAVRLARMGQRLPLSWLRPLEIPFPRLVAQGHEEPQLIFLLALPRSGSTLTYQVLVHALQPLYLSNLWNLLYALPWTGGFLALKYCAHHRSDFNSSYGFVGGGCGPAEGLRFWSYWTGCGLDETVASPVSRRVLEKRVSYLREVIAALSAPSRPLITGYLGHVLTVEQLRTWFPEAVFLRLHRDPLSNAASILRSRNVGTRDWFSVFPQECQAVLGAGLHAEVAAQVYWLNRRLDSLDAEERVVHIKYDDLCCDPHASLQGIVEQCNRQGMDLAVRRIPPRSFEYRQAFPDDDSDTEQLWREFKRLEMKHGELVG